MDIAIPLTVESVALGTTAGEGIVDGFAMRGAAFGHERPFAHNRFLTGQRLPPFDRGLRIIPTMDAGMAHC